MVASLRGVLPPLLRRIDGGAHATPGRPGEPQEGTRFPSTAWDLRTIIVVFPPGGTWRYLNLNTVLGLTGTPFDQAGAGRLPPGEVFDVQLCLEGDGRAVTAKELVSVPREVRSRPGAVDLAWGEGLRYQGAYPEYTVAWRGRDGLELDLALSTRPGVQWWARAGAVYTHYTTFGTCRMRWRLGGESGVVEGLGLHDHGFGARSPVRAPLSVFRYEVLRLGEASCAVALWTEGPLGATLRNAGVLLPPSGPPLPLPLTGCEAHSPEPFTNHAGETRYVPRRWRGHLAGPAGVLGYQAHRTSPPRAVLGDGFLHAFSFEARGTGAFAATTEGVGYVEQIGGAFGRPFGSLATEPPPPHEE